MADSRILHRSAGDSEKVAALSDFQYRVWTQYVLSADDFGVMPASAFVLQADNRLLRQRPTRTVQKALEAVIASGLVTIFLHQGERYVWQADWQDWQGIRHPRNSVRPVPSDLSSATVKTRELFGKRAETSPEDSGNVSETFQPLAGAGGRETLTQTQTQTLTPTQPARASSSMGSPATIINGRSQRQHGTHGRCYEARSLCMTWWVWEELLGRLGGDDGTRKDRLKAWADAKVSALGSDPVGDKPDDFWRKAFARDYGVEPPVTPSKAAHAMAAARRVADTLAQGAHLDPFGTGDLPPMGARALVPGGRAS